MLYQASEPHHLPHLAMPSDPLPHHPVHPPCSAQATVTTHDDPTSISLNYPQGPSCTSHRLLQEALIPSEVPLLRRPIELHDATAE